MMDDDGRSGCEYKSFPMSALDLSIRSKYGMHLKTQRRPGGFRGAGNRRIRPQFAYLGSYRRNIANAPANEAIVKRPISPKSAADAATASES